MIGNTAPFNGGLPAMSVPCGLSEGLSTGRLVDLFRKIHNVAHPGKVTEMSREYEVEFLPPVRAADQL
jgi:hypothetical protein